MRKKLATGFIGGLILSAALFASCGQVPKAEQQEPKSGNPVLEGWYADP